MNRTLGPNATRLFSYSADPPASSSSEPSSTAIDLDTYDPLARPSKNSKAASKITKVEDLEGADADPTFTKVVDRRWYERNKHIFPASTWQDFDPEMDYQNVVKRDKGGNAFFFS
jgi:protein FAM50